MSGNETKRTLRAFNRRYFLEREMLRKRRTTRFEIKLTVGLCMTLARETGTREVRDTYTMELLVSWMEEKKKINFLQAWAAMDV